MFKALGSIPSTENKHTETLIGVYYMYFLTCSYTIAFSCQNMLLSLSSYPALLLPISLSLVFSLLRMTLNSLSSRLSLLTASPSLSILIFYLFLICF
jgi:hypothetical protein